MMITTLALVSERAYLPNHETHCCWIRWSYTGIGECILTLKIFIFSFSCTRSSETNIFSLSEIRDYLLVASAQAVRGIPLNVSSQEDVTLPLAGVAQSFSGSGVEYDASVETVFYNDRMRQLIYRSPINGTSKWKTQHFLFCLFVF